VIRKLEIIFELYKKNFLNYIIQKRQMKKKSYEGAEKTLWRCIKKLRSPLHTVLCFGN